MKQVLNWLRSQTVAFAHVLFPLKKENQIEEIENSQDRSIERIYYNISGRNYSGHIYKGRILKLRGQINITVRSENGQ